MLGWLYWDPDSVAFTLPFIHRPIVWYGILFAIGFLIAFYILRYLYHRFLCFYPSFLFRDVVDWKALVEDRSPFGKELRSLFGNNEIGDREKKIILNLLNKEINRIEIGEMEGVVPPLTTRLLQFAKKWTSAKNFQKLQNRFVLESKIPLAFKAINIRATEFIERMTLYISVGAVVGARLGHILFYEKWSEYFFHPLQIIKIWEGGLASHGAVIGILISVILFFLRVRKEFPMMSIARIMDLVVIPSLFAGVLIRIGNFINQEILGTVTMLPWGIVFGHAADGSAPVPRHPVQLYEALFYLGSFFLFFRLFPKLLFPVGRLSGLVFITVFVFRFFIEFIKEEQSYLISDPLLTMGQYLSIPMVLFGCILMLWPHLSSKDKKMQSYREI